MEPTAELPQGNEQEKDGGVPEKQIHRWKNDGGAVLPADESEEEN